MQKKSSKKEHERWHKSNKVCKVKMIGQLQMSSIEQKYQKRSGK